MHELNGSIDALSLSSAYRITQDPACIQAQPALTDAGTVALPHPETASVLSKRKITQLEQDTATKDQELSAKDQELAAVRKELQEKAAELMMQPNASKRARRAPPDSNSPSRALGTVVVPEVQAELEKAQRALEQERKASAKELEAKQKAELEIEQERGDNLRANKDTSVNSSSLKRRYALCSDNRQVETRDPRHQLVLITGYRSQHEPSHETPVYH